jgi:hypothetical protein
MLRLALKKRMITTNGGFFHRHDPIELPTAPKVTGYCESCNKRFDVPEEHLECPVCGSKEKVHLIASRDVAEVLRLALKKGMITSKRHDPIELLLSTSHYGTTSCIILDVLNKTTTKHQDCRCHDALAHGCLQRLQSSFILCKLKILMINSIYNLKTLSNA